MATQPPPSQSDPVSIRGQTQRTETVTPSLVRFDWLDDHTSALPILGNRGKVGDALVFAGGSWLTFNYVLPHLFRTYDKYWWLGLALGGGVVFHAFVKEFIINAQLIPMISSLF
jgi:hypothetical protein